MTETEQSALEQATRAYEGWASLVTADWYRATCNLAAGLSNEAEHADRVLSKVKDALDAYELCLELISDVLLLREGRRLGCIPDTVSVPPSLRGDVFLEDLRYASVLLLAGVARQLELTSSSGSLGYGPAPTDTTDRTHHDEALWTVVQKLAASKNPPAVDLAELLTTLLDVLALGISGRELEARGRADRHRRVAHRMGNRRCEGRPAC